jgi:hypothetical protein
MNCNSNCSNSGFAGLTPTSMAMAARARLTT